VKKGETYAVVVKPGTDEVMRSGPPASSTPGCPSAAPSCWPRWWSRAGCG
jgi:hypothetical protein